MSDDLIASKLGIQSVVPKTINVPAVRPSIDVDEQFDEVKNNIKSVNDVGEMAMQECAQLASASQQPRAYEVLSTLMGQIVNANKTLLELEKIKLEIEEKRNGTAPDETKTVNNTLVFHGSTAEMMKQLKENDI